MLAGRGRQGDDAVPAEHGERKAGLTTAAIMTPGIEALAGSNSWRSCQIAWFESAS
jgi:hypothetical protein